MTQTNEKFARIIADADAATDEESLSFAQELLGKLLKEGFVPAEETALPYAPGVEMTDAFRAEYTQESGGPEGGFGRLIGGVAVDAANALARAKRRVDYKLTMLFGFDGLRIVEEGDSWTQYPILLEDIGDQLHAKPDLAVFSVGGAGDLVTDMAAQKEYLAALKETGAHVLLLSGGGNDVFGHLDAILNDYFDGASPDQLINKAVLSPIIDAVIDSYRIILADVARQYPGVTVFTHGYDMPYPKENGRWMGPALIKRGIPFLDGRKEGREAIRVILDRFNVALAGLLPDHPNMVYSDLREKVDRGPSSWFDELHPRNAGYARAAAVIETAMRENLSGGVEFASLDRGQGAAERATGKRPVVLDPGHGGRVTIGDSSPNNATGPRGTLEKTLTLDVALRTKSILESRGYSVTLTRDSDRNLSLVDRAAVARAINAAAFVSIHFNASDNHDAQGTETFVHETLPNGPAISKALCRTVQAEMVATLGLRDRNVGFELGAKRGKFGVINPVNHAPQTAAVLHEVSFLDRADEEARLGTVSYKRKIATALADGIEAYLEGMAPAEGLFEADTGLGDAIELARLERHLASEAGRHFDFGMSASGGAEFGAAVDISNGHMLASSGAASGLIAKMAASEARYVDGEPPVHADEGQEPSEFDPAVESTFTAMTSNVSANMPLLSSVFGGAESTGFDYDAFETFILGLGLRHFSPNEFLALGNRNRAGACAGKNHLPPRHLWQNIANTALMIDEIRARLGTPIFITSAYRSPAYNTCIGGVAGSQHMRFNALDWYSTSGTPAQWEAVANAVKASDPRFRGFVKDYPSQNFVHIDTRDA